MGHMKKNKKRVAHLHKKMNANANGRDAQISRKERLLRNKSQEDDALWAALEAKGGSYGNKKKRTQSKKGPSKKDVPAGGKKRKREEKFHDPPPSKRPRPNEGDIPADDADPPPESAADKFRRKKGIEVVSPDSVETPDPITALEAGIFRTAIMKAMNKAGFDRPTPVQAQCWPILLGGNDLVAVAETGTGKTVAYLLPALAHVLETTGGASPRPGDPPIVLIVAPTRELAKQIHQECVRFGSSSGIVVACVTGGEAKMSAKQQSRIAKGLHVLIGTPGRTLDFLHEGTLNLGRTSMLIIDEADRMLDMGFEFQMKTIERYLGMKHQSCMFTATWPPSVEDLAQTFLTSPTRVIVGNTGAGKLPVLAKNITQTLNLVKPEEKDALLWDLVYERDRAKSTMIVFTNTKNCCDYVARNLKKRLKCPVVALHGDKTQGERTRALKKFSSGVCRILVATDVAARGLDVAGIACIINYDYPSGSTGIEDWVHRVGRTGRAGESGEAHTFITIDDMDYSKDLAEVLRQAGQFVPSFLAAASLGFPNTREGRKAARKALRRQKRSADEKSKGTTSAASEVPLNQAASDQQSKH